MARGFLWNFVSLDSIPVPEENENIAQIELLELPEIREEFALAQDKMAKDYAPSEFDWCKKLDALDREMMCADLAEKLIAAGADVVMTKDHQVLLFRITKEQREKFFGVRYKEFKELMGQITLAEFASDANMLWRIRNVISPGWSDTGMLDGCWMHSIPDVIRSLDTDEWYVGSPELLMH